MMNLTIKLPDEDMPEWLRKSWESAKEAGLDQLSMDEIDAEIVAARKARHEAKQPSASSEEQKGKRIMTDDVELIEIRLPSLNKSISLSRETSARIWDAVKRGEASSAEEYVNRKLEEYLIKVKDAPATAQAVSSITQDRRPETAADPGIADEDPR